MAEKKFLSWVGFKNEDAIRSTPSASPAITGDAGILVNAGNQSNIEHIRELETQIADLRSRRDITSLTKEEFEILATETAMTMIKSAQGREARAATNATKILTDSSRAAKDATETAELKARTILQSAETRGRKYIEAAEAESSDLISKAEREADETLSNKRKEASHLTSAAKREAEKLISDATTDISDYRSWLSSAIAEADRLYKIQTQSLNAAEQAIEQSRSRLTSAFERFAGLQEEIQANLDENNRPIVKTLGKTLVGNKTDSQPSTKKIPKKPAAKKIADKKVTIKRVAKKPVKRK